MTTRAQLSAAPTSSTARKTNDIKMSVSMVVVCWCGMGCPPGSMIPAADAGVDALDDPAAAALAASGWHPSRSYTAGMVVGRETELRRVAELLAGVRLRRGGALLVTGEAGVGKSTLLDEVAARSAGALVVRVVGTPAEQEVPYAALGLVLGDVTDELAVLPAPQARALGVALALRDGDPPPAFAVGAATLAVLTRRAEQAPLVVLLDDAHLLDQPSAAALAFAARRLVRRPGARGRRTAHR